MTGNLRQPKEQAAIDRLVKKELEQRTIEAIREYQNRMTIVEALHKRLKGNQGEIPEGAAEAYIEAVNACDNQHMAVGMYIELLGYVPKL